MSEESPGEVERPWKDLETFRRHGRDAGPPGWEERVEAFYEALVAANREVNLTRITSREDFWIKHVADSLLLVHAWPELARGPRRVLDLGCGGGIPSIPLALTFPDLEVVGVDSVAKKIDRVRSMARELGLENFEARAGRGRELGRDRAYTQSFDLAIARAVAETPRLLPECRHFLKPDGRLIAYKTPEQIESERALVEREARKLGFLPTVSPVFHLPEGAGQRQFWHLERTPRLPG